MELESEARVFKACGGPAGPARAGGVLSEAGTRKPKDFPVNSPSPPAPACSAALRFSFLSSG